MEYGLFFLKIFFPSFLSHFRFELWRFSLKLLQLAYQVTLPPYHVIFPGMIPFLVNHGVVVLKGVRIISIFIYDFPDLVFLELRNPFQVHLLLRHTGMVLRHCGVLQKHVLSGGKPSLLVKFRLIIQPCIIRSLDVSCFRN